MKNRILILSAILLLFGLQTPRTFGQSPQENDLAFNVNGTFVDAENYSTSADFINAASALGVDLSGFNTSTGLGTINVTITATGSSFMNILLDESAGVPFFNEFGATSGSPVANETWEIGDWLNSNIWSDSQGTTSDTLTSTNNLPVGSSNFLGTCNGAGCNGDATTAFGYTFIVPSGDQEILTFTSSLTAPTGGFYLIQTNPQDGSNGGNPTTVYMSLTEALQPSGTSNPPPPPPPPPGVSPEPSSWILLATGLGAGAVRIRRRMSSMLTQKRATTLVLIAIAMVMVPLANAVTPIIYTVPWQPTNPAAPHTAYTGANIILAATTNLQGSADHFTYSWNFGDGSAATAATAVTNANDISARHIYAGTTVGQTWTAVVTVTDTNTSQQATGNYLVIWENNTLQTRVNVAIDLGLWYLHQDMNHPTATTGNWEGCASGYSTFSCGNGYGSLTATNVQAFEVNGHFASGPVTDPYTNDVAEGLASFIGRLTTTPAVAKSYTFNPAVNNFGCSDGSAPGTTNHGSPSFFCTSPATPVFYDAGSTSCTTPPCSFKFDANANNLMTYTPQYDNFGYEQGMYIDALVASLTPNALATTGPSGINGQTYQNIVQDMVDWTNYCQYGADADVQSGSTRGGNAAQGGGWWYACSSGDDNSVSQWASIGLIGGQRGFGIPVPPIVTDANNMWVTASQDVVTTTKPIGTNPWAVNDNYGAFGYNGAFNYSDAWGPFAVTPSGMVQMALDGIGRTHNTAYGDASNDPDQRWNNAETYYADNFCNNVTGGAFNAPRAYTYGMFSFTKSMLLHNPGGSLTPIQYLRTQTPGVFTTNASIPANSIDWYAALSVANGGTDPCDGVAQTIVGRQNPLGYWYGDNYTSQQYQYETAWSIIMLQRTVFVNCVNNLGGRGTASTALTPARIDLTWTGIPNVTGYNVLISTTAGGPYTLVGTTTTTSFSDRSGLTNLNTYYFVLQPINASGAVCQSNEAVVPVPKGR